MLELLNVKRMRRNRVEETNNSEAQSRPKSPRILGQQLPDAPRYGQNQNLEVEISTWFRFDFVNTSKLDNGF